MSSPAVDLVFHLLVGNVEFFLVEIGDDEFPVDDLVHGPAAQFEDVFFQLLAGVAVPQPELGFPERGQDLPQRHRIAVDGGQHRVELPFFRSVRENGGNQAEKQNKTELHIPNQVIVLPIESPLAS